MDNHYGKTLSEIFEQDEQKTAQVDNSKMKMVMDEYLTAINDVYHSPNTSPSNPIISGIVSE